MICILRCFLWNLSFLPFPRLSVSGEGRGAVPEDGTLCSLLIWGVYELLDLHVSLSALLTFNKSDLLKELSGSDLSSVY